MSEGIKSDALKFIRESRVCQFATVDGSKPAMRIMFCPRVDDDFTLWFATSLKSNKVRQLKENSTAAVGFYVEGAGAQLSGPTELIEDQAVKDDLWEDEWTRYWESGSSDPDYVVLRIKPDSGDFWDMKKGEMRTVDLV